MWPNMWHYVHDYWGWVAGMFIAFIVFIPILIDIGGWRR